MTPFVTTITFSNFVCIIDLICIKTKTTNLSYKYAHKD